MKKNGKSRDIAPVEEQQYSFSIFSGKQCADFSAQCCRKRGGGKLFGFPTTTRYRLTKWFQMGREKGRNRKLCRELEERKMRDETEKERKNRRENYGYDIKIHKKGLKDPCTRKLCYRPP